MKKIDLPSPKMGGLGSEAHRAIVNVVSCAELAAGRGVTEHADNLATTLHTALVATNAVAGTPVNSSPLASTQKIVSNGNTFNVVDADGTTVVGTITIAAGAIVATTIPGTSCIVSHGATVAVKDAANHSQNATAAVVDGTPTLTLATSTATLVPSGFTTTAIAENAAGTSLGAATITVVAGAITKIKTTL